MEEGLEHYKMNLPVVGLTEMIADHIPNSVVAKPEGN
jgi:hypothetical protein